MYVYKCMFVCIYIYTYIYTHIFIYIYNLPRFVVCACECIICVRAYVCAHVCVRACVCERMQRHMEACGFASYIRFNGVSFDRIIKDKNAF